MANQMKTKEFEDFLQVFEELTINAQPVQEQVLKEIVKRNAGTEYLSRFLINGQTDIQHFKNNGPIVTYEDIKPYIDRTANGEPSNILLADPITEFIRSTGTSGGQPKLIPMTAETFETRDFDGWDKGKTLSLLFVKPEIETPLGLMAKMLSTCYFNGNSFKKSAAETLTSPIETILCLDEKQSIYCQLLTALLRHDEVVRIHSTFASTLARSFNFLQDHWKELCSNIRTGYLSDWITDPGCKNALSSILDRPNPELADSIEQIFDAKSWEGIIKKLWPKVKCISCIITGTMSQYISLLDFYGGGIPLVSPVYASSEADFGINIKLLSKQSDVSYTFIPNMAYFQFLPVVKDGGEKVQELQLDGLQSKGSSKLTNKNDIVEPVDLTNVKLGQYYQVVVTTLTGLYRYRVGDVLKLTGFHNNSPQFQFVERENVVLSIDLDKTSEADLLKAIINAKDLLDPLGLVLTTSSSCTYTSSTPGRYVLFWEIKKKASNDLRELNATIMEQCFSIVEESFDYTYKVLRSSNIIGPLELKVVKLGTFNALMDFYVSKGASISQYKAPCCIKSEEAIKILNSGVAGKYFSPKLSFKLHSFKS